MSDFKSQKISNAMKLLKANSVLIGDSSIDNLEMEIKKQVEDGIFKQYGECLSYEFVTETKVGDFAAKRYYVLRFKLFYLNFIFNLYRTGPNWTIVGFKYGEDGSELFH